MALPRQHAAHRLVCGSSGDGEAPRVTLDFFYDFNCPFCARSFKRVYEEVVPWLAQEHGGRGAIVFRHQVQPWHPQGTLSHEAALAVEAVDASKFWEYCAVLFARQEEFFDEPTKDKSRVQIYGELAALASDVGVSSEAVLEKLKIIPGGTSVTPALKYALSSGEVYFIKFTRQNGVHVSPTVLVNGLVENSISSGWSLDQWKEFLGPLVA